MSLNIMILDLNWALTQYIMSWENYEFFKKNKIDMELKIITFMFTATAYQKYKCDALNTFINS